MIDESGNNIIDGDTIVIDEFNPKIVNDFEITDVVVSIKIDGLKDDESFMVSTITNGRPNRVDCFGDEGGPRIYYPVDPVVIYHYDSYNYAGIYNPTTTLKISFSDGSEVWLTNPIKVIVNASKHFAEISLRDASNNDINDQTIIISSGETTHFTAWVESMGYADYYYWTIVSSNYDENGNNISIGELPGYDEKMDSNVKDFFVHSETNVFKRIITVRLIGYYCQSNEVHCTIIYE